MAENIYWNSYYSPTVSEDSLEDVKWYMNTYKGYMYTRLLQMFSYKNLPDTIPQEMLEYYLLSSGTCFVTKHEDKLYAFQGSLGGTPDPYYRPTKYIVANPALGLSETYDREKDGVLVRNDRMWMGLDKLVSRYAYLMANNIITIKVVDVMLRCIALLSAPDDKSKKSAELYLENLEKGKLGVIGDNPFFEGIKMQSPPANNGSYLTQFIELHQYYKGSFYNEIGLNANFNMKREAIGKGEASLSQDSLLPLCDTMLECRREDIKKINEMFGTNIEVDFASAWKENQLESQLELKKLKNEASQLERSDEDELDRTEEKRETCKGDFGSVERDSTDECAGAEGSGDEIEEETGISSETFDQDCAEIRYDESTDDSSDNNVQNEQSEDSNEEHKQDYQEEVLLVTVVEMKKEEDNDDRKEEDSGESKRCDEST